jgi:acyl-CoA synthetase (AMP-forming)/AMP-acid ligase II/acyl carrier protein
MALEDAGNLKLSYGDLAATVNCISRSLSDHGVRRNSRVAIVLPNGPEMAIALLGVTVTAVAVPLNPACRSEEFHSHFEAVRVGFLIVLAGSGSVARTVAAGMSIKVLELSGDCGLKLSGAPDCDVSAMDRGGETTLLEPDDVAAILMTSGSTGQSKKVPLTHRNLCVSVSDTCRSMALRPEDRCLCMWEQFHISGLTTLLMAPLAAGGTVICTSGFDPAEFYRLVETKKPTWFQGVPTALHELVFHAGKNPVTTQPTSLRLIRSGAAALPSQLMVEIETLFGVPVIQAFGMTEAAPQITATLLPPAVRKPGSVGQSIGPEIRILGPDGSALGSGEVGEVALRGDNMVSGYEDDPEATAHSFRDGWFHTGDAGYLDEDGYLFLKGRLKQMINRGGEMVNPQEIDDALLTHPAVAQAAAFAVKHRTLGEDVGVAVVLKPSTSVTEGELRSFVAECLAAFKVPQRVFFLDRIPRNAVGKIDRRALMEMAEAEGNPTGSTGPASALEEQIAKLWANELNLPAVGLDDNFFAIGGDSLSGVRLFLAVEKTFGKPLPERALVNITTVREMARLIEADDGALPVDREEITEGRLTETERRSLVAVMAMGRIPVACAGSAIKAVNTSGSRKPLFWCFNNPANEMGELVQRLDPEQPLFGLYSGGRLFPRTDAVVSKIAEFYAEEIISLQADGPYVLGGNCQGAKVTLEIARILTASGRSVEKLCLLEYSNTSLHSHDGQLLLMFGNQSRLRAYRPIRWGMPGWRAPFRGWPVVEWVSGTRGRSFRPYNVATLARKLDRFLQDRPQHSSPLTSIESGIIMAIHKIPGLFYMYMMAFRLRDRVIYGKKIKVNPFTGEPLA